MYFDILICFRFRTSTYIGTLSFGKFARLLKVFALFSLNINIDKAVILIRNKDNQASVKINSK